VAARCIDTDVVAEIEAALNYASHRYRQQPVERIWVVGAGSGVPGLCEHLTTRLNVSAAVLSPLAIAKCPSDLTRLCGDGLLTVAAGLAMHEQE
jgi:Tfp pilus assembly PilM family ATPase